MPMQAYVAHRFSADVRAMIERANSIIKEYQRQGFTLTLRQLYYQFVARGFIPNTLQSYKRLGSAVNDGRLAGLIDWTAIEDRTRELHELATWGSPVDIIETCATSFRLDLWETQPYRVEVWIEKEALAGVFEPICDQLRVPYLCCRGYTSQSEMWGAGQRLLRYISDEQTPIILHFGDHDPSGMDMTRDIQDRLNLFTAGQVELTRLALNMDQVDAHNPPPNPAKTTDSRCAAYIRAYGNESWELDALEPAFLAGLVEEAVLEYRLEGPWQELVDAEREARRLLSAAANRWGEITRRL